MMVDEERFTWDFDDGYFIIRDNKTGKKYYQTEIYYLLNEIEQEKEKWKKIANCRP